MWHKLDLNRSINKLYFYKRENFTFYFFVRTKLLLFLSFTLQLPSDSMHRRKKITQHLKLCVEKYAGGLCQFVVSETRTTYSSIVISIIAQFAYHKLHSRFTCVQVTYVALKLLISLLLHIALRLSSLE